VRKKSINNLRRKFSQTRSKTKINHDCESFGKSKRGFTTFV